MKIANLYRTNQDKVVATLAALLIACIATVSPTATSTTSAACGVHTYYPYAVYAYSKAHTFNIPPNYQLKETEAASSGTCNGDETYHGKITINSNSTGGCGFVRYLGSDTTISNCYSSLGTRSTPSAYRPTGTAPMYLCYAEAAISSCGSGPWENRGF